MADGVLFAAITWWCLAGGQRALGVAALLCLVAGQLISYIKARAEGAGLTADGGLVERPERLITSLVGTGFEGLGIPYALAVALWLLAAGSVWTVGQRIVAVYRSARADSGGGHVTAPGRGPRTAAADGPGSPTPSREPRCTPAGRRGASAAASSPCAGSVPPPGPVDRRAGRPGRWSRAGPRPRRAAHRRRVRRGLAAGPRPAGAGRPPRPSGSARDLAARRGGPGARRLRANLRRVVPDAAPGELDALVRAGLRSYARYWCEAFRLPSMDRAAVLARMDPHAAGMAPLFDALAQGRGVVAALPHSGNWDVAGLWFVETQRRLGRPPAFTTVVERLRPESLYRRFVAYRESLGFEVLAAGDGPVVYRTLTQRLRDGGLVCLVADRDLTASGIEVSFFGEPARLPTGPARLAALTGALLLPAFPSFTPDGWAVTMGAPIPVPERGGRDDVAKATQALADALAALIADGPARLAHAAAGLDRGPAGSGR